MNGDWAVIAGLAAATVTIKAVGPVMLGGRRLPAWALATIALAAPALLGALVAVESLGTAHGSLSVDARTAGVAVAGIAVLARAPMLLTIVLAAAVAAGLRALG